MGVKTSLRIAYSKQKFDIKFDYQATNDNVKLFVKSFVVILNHAVVGNHPGTRYAPVDEFSSNFCLQNISQISACS